MAAYRRGSGLLVFERQLKVISALLFGCRVRKRMKNFSTFNIWGSYRFSYIAEPWIAPYLRWQPSAEGDFGEK